VVSGAQPQCASAYRSGQNLRGVGIEDRLIFGRYSLVAEGFNRRAVVENLRNYAIPYKMKQGINSRRTGNLLSRAGNLLRLAGNCPPGGSQLSSSRMWAWLNSSLHFQVRILSGQPYTSLIRPCIFSFRGLRNSPDTSPSRVFRISAAQAIVDSAFPMSSSWCHRFDASIPAKLQSFLPRAISMMTMSIEPLLSLKPTTIPNDRGVRGGPSHNHIRFIRFNFFSEGHLATTSER